VLELGQGECFTQADLDPTGVYILDTGCSSTKATTSSSVYVWHGAAAPLRASLLATVVGRALAKALADEASDTATNTISTSSSGSESSGTAEQHVLAGAEPPAFIWAFRGWQHNGLQKRDAPLGFEISRASEAQVDDLHPDPAMAAAIAAAASAAAAAVSTGGRSASAAGAVSSGGRTGNNSSSNSNSSNSNGLKKKTPRGKQQQRLSTAKVLTVAAVVVVACAAVSVGVYVFTVQRSSSGSSSSSSSTVKQHWFQRFGQQQRSVQAQPSAPASGLKDQLARWKSKSTAAKR
jgi:hypothetical protein